MARQSVTARLPNASETYTVPPALAFIEKVLNDHGFRPGTIGSNSSIAQPTLVAAYAGPEGLSCYVYHRKGELDMTVEVQRFGRYRLPPQGDRAKDDLSRKLAEKFGKGSLTK